MFVSASGDLHPVDLAKEKGHQIEHVHGSFVKEAAGKLGVPDPGRVQELAAIHFGVDRKRTKLVAIDAALENFIDGRKTAIVADLVDEAGTSSAIAKAGSGLEIQSERLLAKNVLASL